MERLEELLKMDKPQNIQPKKSKDWELIGLKTTRVVIRGLAFVIIGSLMFLLIKSLHNCFTAKHFWKEPSLQNLICMFFFLSGSIGLIAAICYCIGKLIGKFESRKLKIF